MAFTPHENNDILKGGKSVPIDCIHCGELVEVARDSYKRVYQEDEAHKYPPIPGNQLRVKNSSISKIWILHRAQRAHQKRKKHRY